MSDQKNTREHEDGESLAADNSLMSLPSFAPREAVKAQQEKMELKAAELAAIAATAEADKAAVVEDGVTPPVADEAAEKTDDIKPEGEPKEEPPEASAAVEAAVVADTPAQPPEVPAAAPVAVTPPASVDPAFAALSEVAGLVMADPASNPGSRANEAELAKVAERLNLSSAISDPAAAQAFAQSMNPQGAGLATVPVSAGQRAQMNGGAALAEGLGMAAGGAMSLVGAAGRVIGRAAQGVASMVSSDDAKIPTKAGVNVEAATAAASSALPSVLPRLSEYRIIQAEKAAELFASEQEKFWHSSPKLVALRGEIDRMSRERGIPKQDLINEMKPGGDLAELRTKFNEAVADNPEGMSHKRSMDKALDSYVRQYGRAQEEMLNPEQVGNPHYEGLKGRLNGAHAKMEESSSELPAFAKPGGELEKAHFEKLREAVAAIMTKIREVIQEFTKLLTGKREVEHAVSP
ncbi:hypothetical protein RCH14_004545 [Massilia sp. MP_M2]|uniref:hypothetical protein n=1 Tax=Massilia sp. MP_M2 TaxID=3071713 RepID=UPI00319E7500